jgi:hypothetical protein
LIQIKISVPLMSFQCKTKSGPGSNRGPMGGTRLELVTSTMSTWRSNQLS